MQDHSCDTCRFYLECAYRLLLEGILPCDGDGYEPYS